MKRVILLVSALSIVAASIISKERDLPPALASLVAAERAFSKTSVEKGVREAFLTFFADDGINFQPHPVNTKQAFSQRSAARQPVTLSWEPVFGDVSEAGDLGFTTGPWVFTDQSSQKRPPQYGYFFSIWKTQADGSWKVVVDVGIEMPSPSSVERLSFQAARHPRLKLASSAVDIEAERLAMAEMDRTVLKEMRSKGAVNGFLSCLDDEARLHRNGLTPRLGREAIRAFLTEKAFEVDWVPINSGIARSVDLGFTYGSYELKRPGSTAPAEKGYYVHVWRRGLDPRWKIVADITNPLPSEEK